MLQQHETNYEKIETRTSYVRLRHAVAKCLPESIQFKLVVFLYSCSHVIGAIDLTTMFMMFYFLLHVAKLSPLTVGFIMFFGGTNHLLIFDLTRFLFVFLFSFFFNILNLTYPIRIFFFHFR